MDFDDLDDVELAAGPTPEDRREELIARPAKKGDFPVPDGMNFGPEGKTKILFLYGGGTNTKVAQAQVNNIFKDVPMFKDNYIVDIMEAPTRHDLSWHGGEAMQEQLRPFGPDFYLYFDRLPYANCQRESWDQIQKTFTKLKKHFTENGPYDGVCGFDMGGEVLMQVATRAQEGDPEWTGLFRFMIMFTTGTVKHLSVMGQEGKRAKGVLEIPAVISWSTRDENHPYTWYEETAMHFAPERREIILHQDGHMPPRYRKGQQEYDRFCVFLEAMRVGKPYSTTDHADNAWNRKIWLPMERVVPAAIPSSAVRRLIVVTDPQGDHEYEQTLRVFQGLLNDGVMPKARAPVPFKSIGFPDRPAFYKALIAMTKLTHENFKRVAGADISVEGVTYTERQQIFNWHCRQDELVNGQMTTEDIISEERYDLVARGWADELMKEVSCGPEDRVAFVGLGTGAFIAFAMAKLMVRERKTVPAGFWAVNPPTRLPFETTMVPGALVDCPVRFISHSTSIVGPPWRWEISTCGPFAMSTYDTTDQLIGTIIDEFKAL